MSGASIFFNNRSETLLTFTSSGSFVVPNGVKFLRILGVGAGAGGGINNAGDRRPLGGDIENIFAEVTPGETVTITIGAGGAGKVGPGSGDGANGGNTIIVTAAKTYYFIGGTTVTGDIADSGRQFRYAQNGTDKVPPGSTLAGGAGYGNGGNAGTTFVDGFPGGIGAGGGCTSDSGQQGGAGGNGMVKIWYKYNI